jgi:cobalt/nickel transport system permease protein
MMNALLWAVHIADGFLAPVWLVGGYVLAGTLALVGAWRVRDEEIPRIALMTSVFFVASQIHVSLGPSTAHLLLNGLLGVMLGRRVLLAIPLGLLLQAVLFGHGGLTSLGVNSCVMALPAVAAGWLFSLVQRIPWIRVPQARSVLAGLSMAIGVLTVLMTILLHCAVLLKGGQLPPVNGAVEREAEWLGITARETGVISVEAAPAANGWRILALVELLIHLPIAALEGLILGFLIGFVARVKPELIGWNVEERSTCTAEATV